MKTQFSKWFEQAAEDPARRRAAIASFTKQRNILLCCALVPTVCALMISFTPTRSPNTPALMGFGALLTWIIVFRVDSHRRVLTLLDGFSKDRDAKPTA